MALNLSDLDGSNGFRLTGIDTGDQSGWSVAGAGDVNGDGIDDVIVGAPWATVDGQAEAGESYVVFGTTAGVPASLDLSTLDGSTGFRLTGAEASGFSGFAVSGAGDVNGDGFDDLIVGAPGAYGLGNGKAYILFGTDGGFAASLDLADIDGSTGFRLLADGYTTAGYSVAGAGDVNGDGIDDLIVGAQDYSNEGPSYVVFGTSDAPRADVDLAALDGTDGFRLGIGAHSVAGAGDINGDGFDDVVVGPFIRENYTAGVSYAVFGSDAGFPASIDLDGLDGSNGFRMTSGEGQDILAVAGAGDVNGDGVDDMIVATPYSSASYVVFGTTAGFAADLDLAALDGSDGFRLAAADFHDKAGLSVAGAGDFNGDGIDDLIVGAPGTTAGGNADAGATYVVFGSAAGFPATLDLAALDAASGLRLDGVGSGDQTGWSVAGAGDVNDDGFDDLIVGAPGASGPDGGAGKSYVVFGFDTSGPLTPIVGGPCRDVLIGSAASEAFHPGGGRHRVRTGGGDDVIFFDDRAGKRDVLTITDFDPASDRLDLGGATVARTVEHAHHTVLHLDGADCDSIVLLGLSHSPLDLI